jgi:formate--tetrahydrofolate ligase
LPICIAKTQYSFELTDGQGGAPFGSRVPVREIPGVQNRLSLSICGSIVTVPRYSPGFYDVDIDLRDGRRNWIILS